MYTIYVNLAHDEVSLTRVSNLYVEVTHVNPTFSFCIIMQQNCSRLMTDCCIYRIDERNVSHFYFRSYLFRN